MRKVLLIFIDITFIKNLLNNKQRKENFKVNINNVEIINSNNYGLCCTRERKLLIFGIFISILIIGLLSFSGVYFGYLNKG